MLQPAVRGSNLLLDVRRRLDRRPSDRSLATIRLTAGRPVDIDGFGMEIEWSSYYASPFPDIQPRTVRF